MAIEYGYTTVATLKGRLGNIADAHDDAKMEQVIEAASREIDGMTNRTFYLAEGETRVFNADAGDELLIDDLVNLTTLESDGSGNRTYGTSWAATDYDLEPINAPARGRPYTRILTAPGGRSSFPRGRRTVRITGDWGWPSVPAPIQEACLLIAVRLFQRSKAPFGITGSLDTQVQYIPRNDPDVRNLIEPFRRFSVGVI